MSSKEIKTPSRRHGGGPGAIPEKAKDFKGSIGKLIKYIGNYKIAICYRTKDIRKSDNRAF